MTLLRDFAGLLAASPGSYVYHLVALFVGQVILGIALTAWSQRRESPFAVRLLALAGTFALTRVVLIVVAALDQAGLIWGQAVAPPLERFLDFATLFVSIWAFLPVLTRYKRIGTTLLAAGLVIGAGIYILTAFLWLRRVLEGSFYNHYWQSSAWEVLSIAILVPTLFVAALSRRGDWGLMACLFALWLAGHSLEYAAPIVDSNAAGWARLANLVAAPVFSALVYRHALRVPPLSRAGLRTPLIRALATLARAKQRGDIEAGLRLTASALAGALDADTLALAVAVPKRANLLRVVALYPPGSAARPSEEITVSAQDSLALCSALGLDASEAKSLQASINPLPAGAATEPEARLFAKLGFDRPGPLVIHPLKVGGAIVGAVLASNPLSQRAWEEADQRILEATGPTIAAALATGQPGDIRNLRAELKAARRGAAELSRRTTELEERLSQQPGRLAAITAGRDQYRQRAEKLAATLRQYEEGERPAGTSRQDTARPVHMRDLIADAAASLVTQLRERDLILSQDLEAELPPVDADRDTAARIIGGVLRGARLGARAATEIMVRARRATGDGEVELPRNSVLVAVSYLRGGGEAESVAGEPELSAARELVQTVGGLAWVERERDGQTTFSFTLPAATLRPQTRAAGAGGQPS